MVKKFANRKRLQNFGLTKSLIQLKRKSQTQKSIQLIQVFFKYFFIGPTYSKWLNEGAEFGDNFEASTSKLLTLFFVVILHLYLHHTTYFKNSGILNRLNQMTLHMVLFCDIFQYQKSYKFDETLVKIAEKIVTMFWIVFSSALDFKSFFPS